MCLEDAEIEEILRLDKKGEENKSVLLKPSAERRPSVNFAPLPDDALPDDIPDESELSHKEGASVDDIADGLNQLDVNKGPSLPKKVESIKLVEGPVGAQPFSVENERKALTNAAAHLDAWMKAHPTTISDDEVRVERVCESMRMERERERYISIIIINILKQSKTIISNFL
jgi:hypothetical protein